MIYCEHGRRLTMICPHCISLRAYESASGMSALNEKIKKLGIGLMSKDTNKVSISNDTNSPESKAGFDSLVQGIIDGEIMTCLSPALRSALRKQFERDRQEIEGLKLANENNIGLMLECGSDYFMVPYLRYCEEDKELTTLRAKAERLERALNSMSALTCDPHEDPFELLFAMRELARQALEGK